ncbi:MAG: hypothetical protein UW45_C0033G0004 [Parcubacteria group bacterium GW2011_GWC2_44_22]|nr:MAG: hypothetical protein UW45_C0033G0004 [Parcubacteria group bacterium GW2011_GWC2_44_22]
MTYTMGKENLSHNPELEKIVSENRVWLPEFNPDQLTSETSKNAVEKAVNELEAAAHDDEYTHISSLISEIPKIYQLDIIDKLLNLDKQIISRVVADHLTEWRMFDLQSVTDKLCALGLVDKIIESLDYICDEIGQEKSSVRGKFSSRFAQELLNVGAIDVIMKNIIRAHSRDVYYSVGFFWEDDALATILRALFISGKIDFIADYLFQFKKIIETTDQDIIRGLLEKGHWKAVFSFFDYNYGWFHKTSHQYPKEGLMFLKELQLCAAHNKKLRTLMESDNIEVEPKRDQ